MSVTHKESTELNIDAKPEIRLIAQMEAMMSFKKIKIDSDEKKSIFVYPEILKEKQDLFNFGVIYGQTLTELNLGLKEIPKDFEKHFEHILKQKDEIET